ncbi:rab11 family-interacting protein 1 isoform X1 [Nothobranchius furzeri]|uniref:RAB11 family interacting protein 5a (Class I) n=3 Tax=Nothobranchius furzeri TaxID=105023 RepID=A0A1A7ZKQ1_NOTFU|nr:transcript variant X1 [Nothobranchius furzeri]
MSSLTVEEDQRWAPTHVQVTVQRGRSLRGKGKHGTSDVYTIIQLGKEKYSTGVAEKTTEPEWHEECSFELQPGVLESRERSGYPAGSNELVLTVMHRALMGLDVFLGQAVIQLDKAFLETRCVKNQWYRLNSKTGKKEKERGDIQVTIQFTRNNLTASMYDLVMKDKGTSTFSKLKERMKGKRRPSDEDTSSAVLPGGYGSLYRMRQRLPSDGGGEEDYEDDEGGEVRRSKMRTFFLRGKLRKSSDTRSSTSLGSESSESSSRGGSLSPTAGISVVVSDLSNSPSNSSNFTADNSPEHPTNISPKSSSLKCEIGEVTITVPQPVVCVNGSHVYSVQPPDQGSGKPTDSLGLGLLQKSLPLSVSLQNLSTRACTDLPKGLVGEGRRWSYDRAGEEEKAAIAAALEKSGPILGVEDRAVLPKAASSSSSSKAESESQGKKQRKNLFSHGRSESGGKSQSQFKDESEQVSAATEERHKGWFGSKDPHSKPSLEVSTKLEPSTVPHPPPLPPSHHPSGPSIDSSSVVSALHHTNPFCHPQTTPPPVSPCNPFYSIQQQNPFYVDILTSQPLKTSLPPLPLLSSSRPPITQLFPQLGNPNPVLTYANPADSDTNREVLSKAEKRPLPPAAMERNEPVLKKLSYPVTSVMEPEPNWEESFDAFAAGRLQCAADLTTERRTQHYTLTDRPLERYCNENTLHTIVAADENINVNDSLNHLSEAPAVPSRAKGNNTHHFDTFSLFLETIPEHRSFESEDLTSNFPPEFSKRTETRQNSKGSTDSEVNPAAFHSLLTISPDPSSSGLGSSAEDDGLSVFSSQSDKFSASSSEEAEKSALRFESFSESAVVRNVATSEPENGIAGKSGDVLLDDEGHRGTATPEATAVAHPKRRTEEEGKETWALYSSSLLELQPESISSSRSDTWEGSVSGKDLSKDFSVGDGEIPGTTLPSLCITTSSPDATQDLLDISDWNPGSPVPLNLFGDPLNVSFITNSPGKDFSTNLLSDQSSSSFLQSLYLSADSQQYQTCDSHPSSEFFSTAELNETLHSANSTLVGEFSNIQTNSALDMAANISQRGEFEGSQREPPETGLTVGAGLLILPAPSDSCTSCKPKSLSKGRVETQHGVLAEMFSNCLQKHNATLHRSNSEGTLAGVFDQLLLPSFGSDPTSMQASSLFQPDPDLPCLTSFAPSLTPKNSSSPVALSALSPPAKISAAEPLRPTQGTSPKPEPEEIEPRRLKAANQQSSPHPVKPLTTAMLAEEKRSVLATGLEKLKSTIHPGRSSQITEPETDRKKSLTEGAGSYYHLTHIELVSLLVQREAELEHQKAEFERQKLLLAKREVELKKLKPQVKDLEDYIDTLLVRIMEQKPTLLQVRSKLK